MAASAAAAMGGRGSPAFSLGGCSNGLSRAESRLTIIEAREREQLPRNAIALHRDWKQAESSSAFLQELRSDRAYGRSLKPQLNQHKLVKRYPRLNIASSIQQSDIVEAPEVSPPSDLAKYILRGPILKKLAFSSEEVQKNLNQWQSLAVELAGQLHFDINELSESEKCRIYHYYLPVFFWCCQQLDSHKLAAGEIAHSPLVIGISAPQGCGKTTVVESLEHLFHQTGRSAASISIDDFYLTAAEQEELAKTNFGNPLLELRGNAGSHDLQLAFETLRALKRLTDASGSVSLPRYDKSANAGRGDRADPASWPRVTGPLDIILFEGWMLGFEPVSPEDAIAVDPKLAEVNQMLQQYGALHSLVDSWIIIQVSDPNWVFKWRLQAEVQMRNRGKAGMTDEQVADFVARYIPAYKAYLPGLYRDGPTTAIPDRTLRLKIDESRTPLES